MTPPPPVPDPQPSATFLTFPTAPAVMERLRSIEGYDPDLDPLLQAVASRVSEGAYEASAFVFILIELVYDFEVETFQSLAFLLPQSVQALTGDSALAGYAFDAYREIKKSIEGVIDDTPTERVATVSGNGGRPAVSPAPAYPAPPPAPAPRAAAPPPEPEPIDPAVAAARDQLMADLQSVQKRLQELGLGTRLSIETALARPTTGNVSRTLKEVLVLRSHLRRFEELLSRAEEQILDAAGDGDEDVDA